MSWEFNDFLHTSIVSLRRPNKYKNIKGSRINCFDICLGFFNLSSYYFAVTPDWFLALLLSSFFDQFVYSTVKMCKRKRSHVRWNSSNHWDYKAFVKVNPPDSDVFSYFSEQFLLREIFSDFILTFCLLSPSFLFGCWRRTTCSVFYLSTSPLHLGSHSQLFYSCTWW